jgi:hypothetical protein
MTAALARPDVAAHDPARVAALAAALDGADPPVAAGRHGGLVGYEPGRRRRRLVELDRRDQVVAAFVWRADGGLGWARCRAADGRRIGIEPGGGRHPAWGLADQVWRLGEAWEPVERLTTFEPLDYERLDHVPPLAEPRRLGAGAGTALLNLVAALMKDQGAARVRYTGPYPTEQLFTALLESFRYDPAVTAPLETFLAGEPLDWLPAPHERHEVAPGVWIQARHEVEKVVAGGRTFYRQRWQDVERREPRVLRVEGDRLVCSLWALGRAIEDVLMLDAHGEVLHAPAPAADARAPAPMPPIWPAAVGALIVRESAAPLAGAIDQVMAGLTLEWGPVPGDLVLIDGQRARIARRLRDAAEDWIRSAPPGPERGSRAAAFLLEIARLLGPAIRLAAQLRLESLPEPEQLRLLQHAETAAPPPLPDSVGRLVSLLAASRA